MPFSSNQDSTRAALDVPNDDLIQQNICRLPSLSKPIVLSVEGNIGAGKSTFLKILKKHFGEDSIEVLPEPVERWTNCRGQNMLEAFYKNPERYAYTFQSFAFITRLMEQQKPQTKPIRILERSGYSDRCFAENAYKSGLMNEVEWAAYLEWWSFFAKSLPGGPSGILYLWTEPETCHTRMSIRSRNEEKGVPIDYLKQLHEKHEMWLPKGQNIDSSGKLKVAHINANEDFEHNFDAQTKMADQVIDLIAQICKENSNE